MPRIEESVIDDADLLGRRDTNGTLRALATAGAQVREGISLAQVCKDMDLVPSAVRRWVQQLDDEVAGRPGLGKPLTPEQQSIRELEGQIRQLKSDNELLKKASALFAREIK